ncbi:MAG: DUF192 domain-containing protein [Myxococcales bacterium]|nr:DUF192 domain-containing protein [Myxococcales bacterium]
MRRPILLASLAAAACSRAPARTHGQDGPSTAPPTGPAQPPPTVPTAAITLAGTAGTTVVHAEVVKSPGRVQKGLMYRKFLADDAGMLFLMGDVDDHHFWMHNTLIALDIMFIGEDLKVVGILENMQPLDERSRGVGAPSLYVLEVNGGWAKAHGVAAGTQVTFDGVDAAAL